MASGGHQSSSSHFPGLVEHQDSKDFWLCIMRGFTVGGTTEYRTATTRSRDGEEMEGGFRGDSQHGPEDLHIGQHDENKTPQC
ncbi:hypothetical protein QYF61_016462 [Mycteria americana]|uniref:Uncharacterized protein n=1 Tax=Mycteria americana TaxID=33587 RepID=A0AAN7MX83_MYCAM|nr:hypothetical protein QYF61_016462 [Mycteria americana]